MFQSLKKKSLVALCFSGLFFSLFFIEELKAEALSPNDTFFGRQWYLEKIQAPKAWAQKKSGKRPVIAILDSGVDIKHPDLKDNIWRNLDEIEKNGIDDDKNGFIDDIYGWDFIKDVNDPSPKLDESFIPDEIAHGTIVAGIAAATANNGIGIAGLAPDSYIMPLLVLDTQGGGSMKAVIKAIDYAIKNDADIINLSFSGGFYNAEFEAAIRRAYKAGILVIAAAGNNVEGDRGRNLDYSPAYPACNDGYYGENMVLGIAATDALDQKALFSSYGKKCVDLSAPGVSIYSTSLYSPTHYNDEKVLDEYYDGYWSGTSMAAPQVAAAAALIIAKNPSLDRQTVSDILLGSSDYLEKLNPDYPGQLGAGRLNVGRALDLAGERLVLRNNFIINAPAGEATTSIRISDSNGKLIRDLNFSGAYKGAINIAAGDLDGDGQDEIVSGAGLGGGPQVQIFSAQGNLIGQFFAYNKNFRGGVKVAVGDVDGDNKADIICAPGPGGGPHVRAFNSRGELLGQFFAFSEAFRGGVNLAVGDVNGDGVEDIICGAGPGGGPQVRYFTRSGGLLGQFFAYDQAFRGGVNVASADIDGGLRKYSEIITAPASRGSSHVRIFDRNGQNLHSFFAYGDKYRGQTNLSAGDIDKDGQAEIICGPGPGGTPHVRIFEADTRLLSAYLAFSEDFRGGVNLAIVSGLK